MTHQAHRVLFSHPCRRGFPARSRAFVLALAAGLFALLLAPAGFAAPVKFDIPGQPAPAALQQFIRQSGHDVLFSYDQLATVQAKAVQGEFEPAEALAHLLAESGFVITPQGARKFLVAPPPPKTGSIEGSVREADSSRPVAGASVTVAGTELSVQTDRRGRFTLSEVPAGEHELRVTAEGLQTTRVVDVSVRGGHRHTLSPVGIPQRRQGVTQLEDFVVSAKKNDGVVELDPFDVEGRREKPFTANMDIPRGINDVQAYYIFDSKSIEMSGATTVEDFLATNVTMNVLRSTNSSNTTSYGTKQREQPARSGRGQHSDSCQWPAPAQHQRGGERLPTRYQRHSPERNRPHRGAADLGLRHLWRQRRRRGDQHRAQEKLPGRRDPRRLCQHLGWRCQPPHARL